MKQGLGLVLAFVFAAGCPKQPYVLPTLPDTVWQPLHGMFEKQAVGISKERQRELLGQYFQPNRPAVRVAVVDWVPKGERLDSPVLHPESVIAVIRRLSCAGGEGTGCEQRVSLQPRPTDESVKKIGGERGAVEFALTVSELAAAINDAVDGNAQNAQIRDRLIINVAVGLDPIKLNRGPKTVELLVRALKRASCAGALVIAPAGNLTGTEGPLIPASLEAIPAATASECAAMGFRAAADLSNSKIHGDERLKTKDRDATRGLRAAATAVDTKAVSAAPHGADPGKLQAAAAAAYAPMVYAVGGLDPLDRRLFIVRPWGQPRLAALGTSVSVPVEGSGRSPYSFPLTGTSMAAAIVTGVAASVWNARPELNAHQVMEHVYAGGVPLASDQTSNRAQTEFCLARPAGPCHEYPVHRVFLCGALESALATQLGCEKKPSDSYPAPSWPETGGSQVQARPCNISGCGELRGPVSAQVPNGAVPQPYISGCPGCRIAGQRVSGILTWNVMPVGMPSVVIKAFDWADNYITESSVAPWTMTSRFDFGYQPPVGMGYIVLEIQLDVGSGYRQTEYVVLLP